MDRPALWPAHTMATSGPPKPTGPYQAPPCQAVRPAARTGGGALTAILLVLAACWTLGTTGSTQAPEPRSYRGIIRAADKVILSAPATGTIGQVPVKPGQVVPAGGKLAFVSAPGLAFRAAEAKAELEAAEARLAVAEASRTLIRWRVKQPKGPASPPAQVGKAPKPAAPEAGQTSKPAKAQPSEGQLLELAIADRKVVVARAEVRAVQTRLRTAEAERDRAWLRSPLPKATVLQVFARKGQSVEIGRTPLVEVAAAGRFQVRFEVPPLAIAQGSLAVGSKVTIQVVDTNERRLFDFQAIGEVLFVAPAEDGRGGFQVTASAGPIQGAPEGFRWVQGLRVGVTPEG